MSRWLVGLLVAVSSVVCLGETGESEKKNSDDSHWGIRLSGSIPTAISLAVTKQFSAEWDSFLELGMYHGSLEKPFRFNERETHGVVQAGVRWHPQRSAFFVGLAIGYVDARSQNNYDVSVLGVRVQPSAEVQSLSLTPQAGWKWNLGSGFTFGADVSLQVPIVLGRSFGDFNLSSNQAAGVATQQTADYQRFRASEMQNANDFGSRVIPFLNFFRLGYDF